MTEFELTLFLAMFPLLYNIGYFLQLYSVKSNYFLWKFVWQPFLKLAEMNVINKLTAEVALIKESKQN